MKEVGWNKIPKAHWIIWVPASFIQSWQHKWLEDGCERLGISYEIVEVFNAGPERAGWIFDYAEKMGSTPYDMLPILEIGEKKIVGWSEIEQLLHQMASLP